MDFFEDIKVKKITNSATALAVGYAGVCHRIPLYMGSCCTA
ncbi:MAG: hypothetical protein SOV49_02975 [Erysipelotrichaceae bacterium]|nr:hypothetical protein [Erysipelotrichaceae bacterium]